MRRVWDEFVDFSKGLALAAIYALVFGVARRCWSPRSPAGAAVAAALIVARLPHHHAGLRRAAGLAYSTLGGGS